MIENIAAIDIGKSYIKIILAKKTLTNFKITGMASEEIDLALPYNEAVLSALKNILTEYKLNGYKIISNFPLEKTIIKNFKFPFSDLNSISAAIPFEAQDCIPFDLNDLNHHYQRQPGFKDNEGRIFFAAIIKENYDKYLKVFDDFGLKPTFVGAETNSLYTIYSHFNKVSNENVILLDIGYSKTIINVVIDNKLFLTRSISIGSEKIISSISNILKIEMNEARNAYENLHLDLTSFDNNTNRHFYTELKISKPKLKKIYESALSIITKLSDQITISIESSDNLNDSISYNRVLISGGASNLIGIGSILTQNMETPVTSLPFLKEYENNPDASNMPLTYGLLLSYIKNKNNIIDFSQDKSKTGGGESFKIYYLAGTFAVLTGIVLLINFVLATLFQSQSVEKFEETIAKQYKNYFGKAKIEGDPIKAAEKKLEEELKKVKAIESVIPPAEPMMVLLSKILKDFSVSKEFDLFNIVINQKIIKITAFVSDISEIDKYKNILKQDTATFKSVDYTFSKGKRRYRRGKSTDTDEKLTRIVLTINLN